MARGSGSIVTSEPKGSFDWVYLNSGMAPKPGVIVQYNRTVALRGGRPTIDIYDRAADGDRPAGPMLYLMHDGYRGLTHNTAYVAGDFVQVYRMVAGEEYNIWVLDVAGTANIAANTLMSVDDGTGKLVAATGQESPFQLNETITAPAADYLAWVTYSK